MDNELQDEYGGALGDPYHCPRHLGQIISDAYGLHEAPCGACEAEMDDEASEPTPFDWAWWLDFGIQNPPAPAVVDDGLLF